jgi:hypothetical protein
MRRAWLGLLVGCWHAPVTAPKPLDTDRDGVVDVNDLCPREAEDLDQFEDGDGCRDPDNDRDRLLDAADACPNDGETWNGFADDDGCPDPIQIDYDSFTDNLFVLEPIAFARGASVLVDGAFVTRAAAWIERSRRSS